MPKSKIQKRAEAVLRGIFAADRTPEDQLSRLDENWRLKFGGALKEHTKLLNRMEPRRRERYMKHVLGLEDDDYSRGYGPYGDGVQPTQHDHPVPPPSDYEDEYSKNSAYEEIYPDEHPGNCGCDECLAMEESDYDPADYVDI